MSELARFAIAIAAGADPATLRLHARRRLLIAARARWVAFLSAHRVVN